MILKQKQTKYLYQDRVCSRLPAFFVVMMFLRAGLSLGDDPRPKLQLLGTISTTKGIALIKDQTSSMVSAFRVGEKVFNYGILIGLRGAVAIIKNPSGEFFLSSKLGGLLPRGGAVAGKILKSGNVEQYVEDGFERKASDNSIAVSVSAAFKEKTLREDLPNILNSATAEPVMENGQIKGFSLSQLEKGSMFEKLGIKENDVITEINGTELNNVAKTIQLLNGMREGTSQVKVAIMRNGAPVNLELAVR